MRSILILLILSIIIGCSTSEQKGVTIINKPDSVRIYKGIIIKMQTYYDSINVLKDSTNQALAVKLKMYLDEAVSNQLDALKLITATNNFQRVQRDRESLLIKLNNSKKELEEAKETSQRMLDRFQNEKQNTKAVTIEKNKLQAKIDNATKLSITAVEVKSYGIRKPYFKDTLIYYETNKASRIKQVIVSFIIPENKLFASQNCKFEIKIHGTAGIPEAKGLREFHETIYTGKPQEISIPFNKTIDWRASQHEVEILCNEELLYTGNLILK